MKEYIVQAIERETIESFDAHNAPELIRCKDCKFMYEDDVFQCAIKGGYFPVHEEWYCADGERRED